MDLQNLKLLINNDVHVDNKFKMGKIEINSGIVNAASLSPEYWSFQNTKKKGTNMPCKSG